ncbi:hypothetical protein F1737_09865 [Methanoplanus sp. FWC-SCC4]|uniref:Uncharacterized protein n=1 Tax=Methanochimaera problematica TaxID=2609417 RepID=A0AA97FCM9_9EURY|nr:hypothetical protein [Methanoplanus sp. FWC-SCC4]WOF16970.1 hypothetical protein F1737_09865 [Methanoplanus sp. FWC-SCC4]
MKIKILTTIFLLILSVILASAAPPIPCDYYGSVTIDGKTAPAGTVIVAKVDLNKRGEFTVTTPGVFGDSGTFDDRLFVSATEEEMAAGNPEVTFWYGTYKAKQTSAYTQGGHISLNLEFTTSQPPDAGVDTPVGKKDSSFGLDDMETEVQEGGKQKVNINTFDASSEVTVDSEEDEIIISDSSSGWDTLRIRTQGEPTVEGGNVSGTVESVSAKSKPVKSEELGADVGQIKAQFSVEMGEIPAGSASIETTISKEPPANQKSAFILASENEGNKISEIAYTMTVNKANIENEENGGLIKSATIYMSVSHAWAVKQGVSNIFIYRRPDNGGVNDIQKLATTYVGTDPDNPANDLFRAESPNGLSTFILSSIKSDTPAPQPVNPGGSGGGGSGGSGGSAGDSYFKFNPDEKAPVTKPDTPDTDIPEPKATENSDSTNQDNSESTTGITLSLTQLASLIAVIIVANALVIYYIKTRKDEENKN